MKSIDSSIQGLLAAQQGSLHSKISFTVAAKQLDAQQQEGRAAAKLLDTSVRLSKEIGKGERIDSRG